MLKVLLFTYEFCDPIFSGNGTHGRVLVDALLSVRPCCSCTVICATPSPDSSFEVKDRLTVGTCPVDAEKWRRLDVGADWEGYSDGAVEAVSKLHNDGFDQVSELIRTDSYLAVAAVDWSGFMALRKVVMAVLGEDKGPAYLHKRAVYLNFRVFGLSSSDTAFYRRYESQALCECRTSAALADYDCRILALHAGDEHLTSKCRILPPPVRATVLAAAAAAPAISSLPAELLSRLPKSAMEAPRRMFVTCCVRMSQEKETHRFVTAVRSLKGTSMPIIPLLLGTVGDVPYATALKASLLNDWGNGCIILDSFVSAEELTSIFQHSLINIHPSSYDAFGLTITEAAVAGCPTAIICGPSGEINVGATQLLSSEGYVAIREGTDLQPILAHSLRLSTVASVAQSKAASYDQYACGRLLSDICGL